MPAKSLTISIPEDLLVFLDENPTLSPSKVFQSALHNLRDTVRQNPELNDMRKLNADLSRKNDKLQRWGLAAVDFIERKGLWPEYENSSEFERAK